MVNAKTNPGSLLRQWRQCAGYTQIQLAAVSGWSVQAIGFAERGATNPSWGLMTDCAQALGYALLIERVGDPIEAATPARKQTRLTDWQVIEGRRLRRDERWTYRAIAIRLVVAENTIRQAIIGDTWKHLPGAVR